MRTTSAISWLKRSQGAPKQRMEYVGYGIWLQRGQVGIIDNQTQAWFHTIFQSFLQASLWDYNKLSVIIIYPTNHPNMIIISMAMSGT